MLDYQIIGILFFVCFFLSILVVGLIEAVIKKHRSNKETFAKLVRENEWLKNEIYRLKFNAELRGLNIDV